MFKILVRGAVQGVGFRPFVKRLALKLGLNGYVKNTGDGSVEILVDKNAKGLVKRILKEKPPLVKIEDIKITEVREPVREIKFTGGFKIMKSGGKSTLSLPPPDVSTCDKCLSEVFDKSDRRYLYPFTSCTDCGPRFTISYALPFDRKNTSLREFALCEECRNEYENINDRRYYAQTIACPKCGPKYIFIGEKSGGIKEAAEAIDDGKIIAIKGIGGYHIACLTEEEVVERLRRLLKRPQQPFAIMASDIRAVEKAAFVGEKEVKELLSPARPIVILRKRIDFDSVAPGLDTVGVMLPYTPLHHVLFREMSTRYIVMTSANFPGEPMYVEESIMKKMRLDGFLMHDMKVANRVDDSVVKFCGGKRLIIRRSRGFVPSPLRLNLKSKAIALGAELYNSFAILKEGKAILSQYIGDTANFKTYNEFLKPAVDFFIKYTALKKVNYIISDMHPLFNTTAFAESLARKMKARHLKLQHHFAHALAAMGENSCEKAVAIAVDGVGYGMDGSIWGGEVLYVDLSTGAFERRGRLEAFELIGGDKATFEPLRVVVSLLKNKPELLERYSRYGDIATLLKALPMAVKTTSAGRVLDAASAMLEVCFERTYEGEPAMKLEAVARESEAELKPVIKESREKSVYGSLFTSKASYGDVEVLQIRDFFSECTERYLSGESKEKIAFEVIAYLAEGLSKIALKVARKKDTKVFICGGVCYNRYFIKVAESVLGNRFVVPTRFPPGDNGIALGQIYALKSVEGS